MSVAIRNNRGTYHPQTLSLRWPASGCPHYTKQPAMSPQVLSVVVVRGKQEGKHSLMAGATPWPELRRHPRLAAQVSGEGSRRWHSLTH